jgi:flagellar biosynthetic protein FliS
MAMQSTAQTMRYLETSLESLSKEDLTVKVFDAIVLFSRQAVEKMTSAPRDIQGRHDLLRRAQRACAAAMCAIDLESAGELGRSNFELYKFWHYQLVRANIEGDVTRVEAVLPQMQMMRDAWAEAVRRFKLEGASQTLTRLDVVSA